MAVEYINQTDWRYENFGNALLLDIASGTTVTDLDTDTSKTGSAFSCSVADNIFGLPATTEIWAKFDVFLNDGGYLQVQNRRKANSTYYFCGVRINGLATAAANRPICVLYGNIRSWTITTGVDYTSAIHNQVLVGFHTVLLHLLSDSEDGKVEIWIDDDSAPLLTYSGNVNWGDPFENFYIYTKNTKQLISNVQQLYLTDNATIIGYSYLKKFDTSRQVNNRLFAIDETKVLLQFDDENNPAFDSAGGNWTFFDYENNPVQDFAWFLTDNAPFNKACNFNGDCQLKNNSPIAITGRPITDEMSAHSLTLDFWLNIGWSEDPHGIFEIVATEGKKSLIRMYCNGYDYTNDGHSIIVKILNANNETKTYSFFVSSYEYHHYAFVLDYSTHDLTFYLDGSKLFKVYFYMWDSINISIGKVSNIDGYLWGTVDEFRLIDGLAVWTGDSFDVPNEPQGFFKLYQYYDTFRQIFRRVNLYADTLIKIPHQFIISPAEGGVFIAGTENADIESLEISLSAQQLTDQITYATVKDVDIMEEVKGQYLDYKFNVRIEELKKQGILSTCKCCSDVDAILYTQLDYKIKGAERVGGIYAYMLDDGIDPSRPRMTQIKMMEKPKAKASAHIGNVARVLGKQLVAAFSDFVSTLETEQSGITYGDIIRDLFGWTSRLPHMLINCYIRDDKLYAIQRGYEQNTIDLTDCEYTIPIIEKTLIRTAWGNTPTTVNQYYWQAVEGGALPEREKDPDDDEPDNEPEEPEEESDPLEGLPSTTVIKEDDTTTVIDYTYNGKGAVTSVENTVYEDGEFASETDTDYDYDDAGSVISTVARRYEDDGGGGREYVGETVSRNSYDMVGDQKKLTGELTVEYDEDGEIISSRSVSHGFIQGQTHLQSNSNGSASGATTSSTPDVRGSEYEKAKLKKSKGDRINDSFDNWDGWYTYGENGQRIAILGFQQVASPVDAIFLYDSSFPVDGAEALQDLTNQLKWLNRKTQETISFDLYDYPHVIDFNDKIIFNGNIYFLEINTIIRTPRIVNKQSLTLVRWY